MRLGPPTAFVVLLCLSPHSVLAQDGIARFPVRVRFHPSSPVAPSSPASRFHVRWALADAAPPAQAPPVCNGCPPRHVGRPYLEALGLDLMYNGINHLRGHHTARVGFKSMYANLKHGFEWDANPWLVNQIGHPYQGSNYYTAGRANGLSFWEAGSVAAFGSGTWEYFAENNRASLNDLINTTLGGIALGEVQHRLAWVVRDPGGPGRKKREMIATAIDPMGGLTRMMAGDFDRASERPSDLPIAHVGWRGTAGVLHQGASLSSPTSAFRAFMDLDLLYGDVRTGRSRVPFEAFTLRIGAGGGSGGLSEAGVRGRLYGQPLGAGSASQLNIFQTFDYVTNRAYAFGAQGFEIELSTSRALSPRTTVRLAAIGGANILGAVDSPLPAPESIVLSKDLLARRTYDYGPGGRFGGFLQITRDATPVTSLTYQGFQVSVVDGARAIHILQRLQLDVRMPVHGGMAVGASGEFFFRKAYFWPAGHRTVQSPQVRVFVSWEQP